MRKRIYIALSLLIGIIVLLLLRQNLTNNRGELDYIGPNNGVAIAYYPADKPNLLETVGRERLQLLTTDMAVYGSKFSQAKNKTIIGNETFLVDKVEALGNDKIQIKGLFRGLGLKATVELTTLNNNRMVVSIIGDDFNINDELPSNSALNKFISGLSVLKTKDYAVFYSLETKKLTIQLSGEFSDDLLDVVYRRVVEEGGPDLQALDFDLYDVFYITSSPATDNLVYLKYNGKFVAPDDGPGD